MEMGAGFDGLVSLLLLLSFEDEGGWVCDGDDEDDGGEEEEEEEEDGDEFEPFVDDESVERASCSSDGAEDDIDDVEGEVGGGFA